MITAVKRPIEFSYFLGMIDGAHVGPAKALAEIFHELEARELSVASNYYLATHAATFEVEKRMATDPTYQAWLDQHSALYDGSPDLSSPAMERAEAKLARYFAKSLAEVLTEWDLTEFATIAGKCLATHSALYEAGNRELRAAGLIDCYE